MLYFMKCKWCDADFETNYGNKVYCSVKCRLKANEKTYYKNCMYCKKGFLARKAQKLCSHECFCKNRRDPKSIIAKAKLKYPEIKGLSKAHIYRKINQKKHLALLDRDNLQRVIVIQYLGGQCVKCSYKKDIRALQLDHINGDGKEDRKKYGARICRYYAKNLEESKEKLQVLCANCHAIKSYVNEELTREAHRIKERSIINLDLEENEEINIQ